MVLLSAHHLHKRFVFIFNRIILYYNCCLLSCNPSLYADLYVVLQMIQTQTVKEELPPFRTLSGDTNCKNGNSFCPFLIRTTEHIVTYLWNADAGFCVFRARRCKANLWSV